MNIPIILRIVRSLLHTRGGGSVRFRRRGATLLLCLFTVLFTSIVLTGLMNSVRIQVAEQAATTAYERANYLAGAGVHEACSFLQDDLDWRAGVALKQFPPGSGDTYQASAVDGPDGEVIITGIGTAAGVTRVLKVTIN